jgi:hypothetical protein
VPSSFARRRVRMPTRHSPIGWPIRPDAVPSSPAAETARRRGVISGSTGRHNLLSPSR